MSNGRHLLVFRCYMATLLLDQLIVFKLRRPKRNGEVGQKRGLSRGLVTSSSLFWGRLSPLGTAWGCAAG